MPATSRKTTTTPTTKRIDQIENNKEQSKEVQQEESEKVRPFYRRDQRN